MSKSNKTTLRLLFILLCVSILVLYLIMTLPKKTRLFKENFEQQRFPYDLTYYVITMGQSNRLQNIQKQIDKLNASNIFVNNPVVFNQIDAVKGDDLDIKQMVNDGKIIPELLTEKTLGGFNVDLSKRKYEIGCYLSHMKAYETIEKNGDPNGYSIIFEDDLEVQDHFYKNLKKALDFVNKEKMDFDVLFLGLHSDDNELVGSNVFKPVCHNIYTCYYTHAYLIPNSKATKLKQKLTWIENPVDIRIVDLGEQGELKILRVMPDIVNQNSPITGSVIRD